MGEHPPDLTKGRMHDGDYGDEAKYLKRVVSGTNGPKSGVVLSNVA